MKIGRVWRLFKSVGLRCATVGFALAAVSHPAFSETTQTPYWLKFGKAVHTCASGEAPFKVQGASWGVLASGIVLCRPTSSSYTYTLLFLNVFIDPADKQAITRDTLNFDWCGLAMYRPDSTGQDIEWRYEKAMPIQGTLHKDGASRIVFGNIEFSVPKADADAATNMLFYLTFQGPLLVVGAI